jgi:hypothetical protein
MANVSIEEIVQRLLRETSGAKRQDPSGVSINRDGEAPALVQFGSPRPPKCCRPGAAPGDDEEGELEKGTLPDEDDTGTMAIRVYLSVAYRGHIGNGVANVEVSPLNGAGHVPEGAASAFWELTDPQRSRSIHEAVSHIFSICFACSTLSGNSARFQLTAMDKKGNESTQVIGITLGRNQILRCCAL